MSFKFIQKLNVGHTLTMGEIVSVGVLAQNYQGVFGDSLPDSWGLLLQDRVLAIEKILGQRKQENMALLV